MSSPPAQISLPPVQAKRFSGPAWLLHLFPFLRWASRVNRGTLKADLLAGLTGAVVVLPQGVAFATIAGMPPEYGLYAGIVPAIVAALWGSSWHLVSGPTTAASIVVFSGLSVMAEPGSADYVRLALTLTLMVGVLELAMGLARLGSLVNFISHSVVVGFTAGAAFLIAANQFKNFFGIEIPRGLHFHEMLGTLLLNIEHLNPFVTGVGIATLVLGLVVRHWYPRVPYMIVAMVGGSLIAYALNQVLGIDHTGIRTVGALPDGLPPLSMPDFSLGTIRQLAPVVLATTLFALTEAVSIARSLGARSPPAHRRQSGVHRPGLVEHRRVLLLRLCGHRLLQPQRAQLPGRGQDPAGGGRCRRLPGRGGGPGRPAGGLPAQRGHGGDPVPGRLGADRFPCGAQYPAHQPLRDRGAGGDLLLHPVPGVGVRHHGRGAAVPGAVSEPHRPPQAGLPGPGPEHARTRLRHQPRPAGVPAVQARPPGRLTLLRRRQPCVGEPCPLGRAATQARSTSPSPRRGSTSSTWPGPSSLPTRQPGGATWAAAST